MSSVKEHLNKIREERIAREKARIEKLRELNLKKYSKADPPLKLSMSNISVIRPVKLDNVNVTRNNVSNSVKNNFHINGPSKRPTTAPVANNRKSMVNKDFMVNVKPKPHVHNIKTENKILNVKLDKTTVPVKKIDVNPKVSEKSKTRNIKVNKVIDNNNLVKTNIQGNVEKYNTNKDKGGKTVLYNVTTAKDKISSRITNNFKSTLKPLLKTDTKPVNTSRKSLQPAKLMQSVTKPNLNRQSVFERLYQPKVVPKKQLDEVEKLQTDSTYLQKVIRTSGLILKKRHTLFETQKTNKAAVRRSISAVHFKWISKSEIPNCIQKWSSVEDKLDKKGLKDVNEDESVKEDKVVSAVKSERRKVKFQTPNLNFNTPKPEEMQARLHNWLQKRGKSLDSFHHLQCFGIHHLSNNFKPVVLDEQNFDDEDKENVPLESDSDNDSYEDNMNNKVSDGDIEKNKWRRASYVSDSVDFNDTQNSVMTSADVLPQADELIIGALNDLTDLLREGFDWDQSARWLRAIRERFPDVCESAAYWECRAALEERRGDLQTSIECWEQAIAKGTERSIVEANLDQLLDKFMQLKISPNSGKKKQVDPKLIDVKNIFKSTIIRFAVQQAKLRQSNQSDPPPYTCTPVRRSGRLSAHWSDRRTPLRVCTSVKQAGLAHPLVFVPNRALTGTP